MKLRKATLNDASMLLRWRNDSETRKNSHNNNIIKEEEHIEWLCNTIADPYRQLYVAVVGDMPVGTARADFEGDIYELSWTIAPEERGKGYGKAMVELLTQKLNSPVRAEVFSANTTSAKIAEGVGMTLDKEESDVLYFSSKWLSS